MCEDYPCCGHGSEGCSPQWFDEPDAFDTSKYPHALCEHEYGICDVEPEFDGCDECGEDECVCEDYPAGDGNEDAFMSTWME